MSNRTTVRITLGYGEGTTREIVSEVSSDRIDADLEHIMMLVQQAIAGCGFHHETIAEYFK